MAYLRCTVASSALSRRVDLHTMQRLAVPWLVLCLCLCVRAESARAIERRDRTPPSAVEEVLVTGEHPGPGMWRVVHEGHALWILGTHAPLPQRLRWRSQEVEIAISEAQQVLGSYSAFFVVRGQNPLAARGKPLRRLLSRREYAQWRALKRKYIGEHPEIETALPVTAALVLRSNAFARAGLVNAEVIVAEVQRLADAYRVPVTTDHQVTKIIESVPQGIHAQRRGVAFLVQTMKNLEADVATARARANAWAVGDIEALRARAAADTTTAQLYASSWPYLTEAELTELVAETERRWLDAAERALRSHETTVATLPIFMLLRPGGLLDALRARGFEVIEPME